MNTDVSNNLSSVSNSIEPVSNSSEPISMEDISGALSSESSLEGSISNESILDISGSGLEPVVLPMSDISSSDVESGEGYRIEHKDGYDEDGDPMQRTTFETTEPEIYDPQIEQNLTQLVETYDDSSQTSQLLSQIQSYATELQCTDFHGKGTIDDYNTLFEAASKIATDTKQMELDVDVDGFNEFATAADDLSALFDGFIMKLQNVSIITYVNFLTSISNALEKVVNLSNTFGRFKQTVFSTSAIQLPQSAHTAKNVIESVMSEVNCAMQYVNHFVAPEDASLNETALQNASLSPEEKTIIEKSVTTIENWNTLCEYGVGIAMSNDPNIQYLQGANDSLKTKSVTLKLATNKLRTKLAFYNIL